MQSSLLKDIAAGRHAKASDLVAALNISKQAFYDAVARQDVKVIRIGKTIRVPAHEAARLLGISAAHAA